jgi:hypothetical protein
MQSTGDVRVLPPFRAGRGEHRDLDAAQPRRGGGRAARQPVDEPVERGLDDRVDPGHQARRRQSSHETVEGAGLPVGLHPGEHSNCNKKLHL